MKIFVPRDAAAIAVGADHVGEALLQAAAVGGIDLTLVRTSTRGLFWLEPLVEVETPAGRIGYGPATPADAASILNGSAAAIALGRVDEIPVLKRQTRLTFARAGVTDSLSLDDHRAHGGFRGLERALSLGPTGTIEEVKRSGLHRRGGAGFPTAIKWETVGRAVAPRKYIVCNADEGDSGTFADRMILEGDPILLIEGMTIAAAAVGATKGFTYIRSEYPHGIAAMEQALGVARRENLLGLDILGSQIDFDIEIRMGAGAYVCGEETALLESIEGQRGQVRAKPPIPALRGLFGQQTVVNNTLSFAAIPFILSEGAAAYADFGMGRLRA